MAVKIVTDTEWGTFEIENAASEDTLLEILAALDKDSDKNKKTKKADEEAAKAAEEKAKADREGAKVGRDFSLGFTSASNAAVKGLKDITLTAVSMAVKFGTDFVNIAENPIKETAKMFDALVDVGANVVSGFAEAIPVIGGFIAAAAKATAELAKAANKMFADQLQRNIDALQSYAKVGISFSGSMTQMAAIAHSAGLGVADFAKVVANSKADLNMLGLAGGEAAAKLAGAMGKAEKMIGRSGQNLRVEMFKMGFTFEEQGPIFASFMANMQAAGKLEKMSREEIAAGTRRYAADLKVVADFTGQDAKKLAERARQQQLMVAAQQELSVAERDRLGQATQILARMGPEGERATQALTQMLLRGATNVQGYTMGPGREMIETMMSNIKTGQEDVFSNAGKAMSRAQQQVSKDQMQGAISVAKQFGVAGDAIDGFAQFQQGLFAQGKVSPEMIADMRKAAEVQATLPDKALDATAKLYDQTKRFQVEMEQNVNPHLAKYAGLLQKTNDLLQGNFMKFIESLAGEESAKVQAEADKRYKAGLAKTQQGLGQENLQRMPYESEDDYRNRMIDLAKRTGNAKFDSGGKIGHGQTGLVGENGPEFIGGPASVLSRINTEKLVAVIDAMRELSGTRFGENDFNSQLGMNADRMAKVQDRIKGFEEFNYKQLEAELRSRPEMNDMAKARSAMSDDEAPASRANAHETNNLLAELIQLMRNNVDYTARVAMNTN